MKNFIDFVYTLLIAASVTLFVSLGIWTFYSGPKFPQYPEAPYIYNQPSEAQQKQITQNQKSFDNKMKDYNKKNKTYNRNIAAIALASAVVFFVIGMFLIRVNDIVGEGLALGGVSTEVYATIRGAIASSKPLVFVSICLVMVTMILLAVFRRRFIHPSAKRA